MNARIEAKLNMYRRVEKICDDNEAIIAINPAFMNGLNTLKANITSLQSTASLEGQIISGIALDKTVSKKNLCQSTAVVSSIVYAYATAAGNNTLANSVNYRHSDLIRLKDDLIAPLAQNVHNAATENAAALADYGISLLILKTFQNAIDNYSTEVPKPSSAKSQKATYTANIKQLIKETDSLLKKQLDRLLDFFKLTSPDFYSTYKNARVIIDARTSATQIKGIITDVTTGAVLAGASVGVAGTELITSSGANGTYSLKSVKPGILSISTSKQGYHTHANEGVIVKLGQATTLNIQLEKI